jgi:hypothetical protein
MMSLYIIMKIRLLSKRALIGIAPESHLRFEEEADRPKPLRSLMIIPTARMITVHIVTSVILVTRIQSLDSHAILFHQNLLNFFTTDSSMIFFEEIWSISHGNADVGT